MKSLLKELKNLRKSKIKSKVNRQLKSFKELGHQSNKELFKELCFCLLTANYNAVGGIKIQNVIGDGFYTLNEKQLSKQLKELGHRFPNARAKYISEAQAHKTKLKSTLSNIQDQEARDWLVENVKGLGMKEASHFLRNIGYENLAIIDFHIVDLLIKHRIIKKPKTLTKQKYLEIEDKLKELGKKANMNMAELDLYLWYMETGKILK